MTSPNGSNQMPAVFVSHGSPMAALDTGPYSKALKAFGSEYRPEAILVVSAHWESGPPVRLSSASKHSLIYDFAGFPQELYELTYDAPGAPDVAARAAQILRGEGLSTVLDPSRGLDHGAWVPLRLMYPEGGIPVTEISLSRTRTPEELHRLGRLLQPLRSEGVLVLASGGIVHNLHRLDWESRTRPPESWAKAFDDWFKAVLDRHEVAELFRYRTAAPYADLAVPTTEHFDPVFVTLGASSEADSLSHLYEGFEHGTLSMRSYASI